MEISEGDIIKALDTRKDYILGNLENVTLKALRKDLESDLGLEKDALKPWKSVVSKFVDKLLSETKTKASEPAEKEQAEKDVKKPQQNRKGREFSARFLRMRNVCKMATITIPVSLYKKDNTDEDMEKDILDLLKKNGLDEKPGKAAIMEVKEKLQLQRDLDGIDTSNIIEDGPRSRRRQAAARSLKETPLSEEEEEEEEGSAEEGSSEEGEDPEDEDGSLFTAGVDDQEDPPSTIKSKRPKLIVSSDEE